MHRYKERNRTNRDEGPFDYATNFNPQDSKFQTKLREKYGDTLHADLVKESIESAFHNRNFELDRSVALRGINSQSLSIMNHELKANHDYNNRNIRTRSLLENMRVTRPQRKASTYRDYNFYVNRE